MTWDFSTEPEFEAQLDWMREFVRDEIWPLETLDLDWRARRVTAPLQEQVKERGLWAAHLDPELGGQGFGQVKLGADARDPRQLRSRARASFGNQAPDSGNSEILALAGTPEQKERWLDPLLAGELRRAFSMTEPDAGLRSDPARDPGGARRRRVGHRRAQVVLVQRLDRRLPHRDGGHRPGRRRRTGRSMFIVPVDTPGVTIVRDVPTMAHPAEGSAEAATPRSVYDNVRVPAETLLGDEGGGFLIAQQRLGPGRIHHACAGSARPGAPST